MRICYIANSGNSHTAKWATYFSNLGHDVHIISHNNIEIPGTTLHYVDYSLKNFPFKAGLVHKIVRDLKPDILHAQQANTCGLYAVSMKDYKVIVSAWGSDILVLPKESFVLKKIVQYVVKNAYFITSDSSYMSEEIIKLGAKKDKVYTFPMGVEDNITGYKHIYDDNNKLMFISTRKLEDIYNIDILVEGFYLALKENSNIYLTVAADGSKMENLKDLVKRYGIEDKVEFTGRYKPQDIGKMLEKNDVFISIPASDSTSVSLLEGMCCGLFSIVSDLPANREWIKHMDNGYIIQNIDAKSVKDALLWCAANKRHLKEVADKNRKIIFERALWRNNVKIVENLYEKIYNLSK